MWWFAGCTELGAAFCLHGPYFPAHCVHCVIIAVFFLFVCFFSRLEQRIGALVYLQGCLCVCKYIHIDISGAQMEGPSQSSSLREGVPVGGAVAGSGM